MTNKHMKKCSTSLATTETQIKRTLRFHPTPVRIVIIKETNDGKGVDGERGKEPLYAVGESVN
jgi:hypothetical protein